MQYKASPEDFKVDEIFDLEAIKGKNEEEGNYHYFLLRKRDYTHFKAIEKISSIFGVSPKKIHYAGTKDRTALTTQLISIQDLNEKHIENKVSYFNEKLGPDLFIEYLGHGTQRVNLGDNIGNRFTVTLRDIKPEEMKSVKERIKKISQSGFANAFGEQRFGFAGNSGIIGEMIINNDIEGAVKEILCSMPPNAKEEHKKFVENLKASWPQIKGEPPQFMSAERDIVNYLRKNPTDFAGALRTLPKKLRTLYINAYQSYHFNLELKNSKNLPIRLPLINPSQKLKHMPELAVEDSGERETRVIPGNMQIVEEGEDYLTISFDLPSGSYATVLLKELID